MLLSQRATRGIRTASLLVSIAGLILAGLFPIHNTDTFGHLAQGRQIVESGEVPDRDPFSFWRSEPQPWHNYEWLTDVLFWVTWDAGGPNALLGLKLALLALLAGLLSWRAFDRNTAPLGSVAVAVLLLFAIPAVRFRLTARPHVLGFVFAAALLLGLRALASEKHPRRAWMVVGGLAVMHVAWVNAHGSHLLGLVFTGIHLIFAWQLRPARTYLGALLGFQLLASCISPFGPAILWDAVEHVFDPAYRDLVTEWAPWKADDPVLFLVATTLWTLVLAVVAKPLWRAGPTGRAALATAALLAVMGFRSVRFVGEYLLLASPLLASGLALGLRELDPRKSLAGLGTLALMGSVATPPLAATAPPDQPLGIGMSEAGTAAAAGRFLEEHTDGARVLASVQDAWYLMFRAPEARFLVDGRIPFYGPEHLAVIGRAHRNPRAYAALLQRFDVDAVVVEHGSREAGVPLAYLERSAAWALVSVGDTHALFLRTNAFPEVATARALDTLPPGYRPRAVFEASTAEVRRDLERLDRPPHTRGYRAFIEGLGLLRPLAREAGRGGLRPPADARERQRACEAAELLKRAAGGTPERIAALDAWWGLAAIACCDLEQAEQALEAARENGEVRETLFGAAELALRRGDRSPAGRLIADTAGVPEAQHDPWLSALQGMVTGDVTCGPR